MHELALPVELEQQIVNGIMKGEQNYLRMRLRENPNLIVSNGLSWARGNYIDTYVGKETETNSKVTYNIAKAGYAWGYLQFAYAQSERNKSLIFVKNIRTIGPQFNGSSTNISDYINEYAGINNHLVNNGKLEGRGINGSFQMELLPSKSMIDSNDVDRFYIVTYDHDEGGQLSKIILTMPNQRTNKLFQVEDLSELMNNSGIEFNDDELNVAGDNNSNIPDAVYGQQKYSFEVPTTQTEQSKKEG